VIFFTDGDAKGPNRPTENAWVLTKNAQQVMGFGEDRGVAGKVRGAGTIRQYGA
jgi:hypothetical protein